MNKLDMKTENITQGNIERIRQLFPNAVTEAKKNGKTELAIDFDVLKQELSESLIDEGKERYQMTWPGKRRSVVLANTSTTDTLRPCKEESVDFDNTQNLYIEGDNLNVLKLLRETYLSKIKMIYIDPPYNTGNDFIYNDDFAMESGEWRTESGDFDEQGNRLVKNLESNGRFHTDWLNMLYPRLRLARDLLTDDGVIFISIDDNEQANLKKICDEIFGESNFIACLVWEKKKKGSFLSNSITNVKEYIIVYCKTINNFKGLIGGINDSVETYPCVNAVNKREIRIIPAGIESKYSEKNYFLKKGSIISDTTMTLILHSDLVIRDGKLAEDLKIEGNWRYSQAAMTEYAHRNEIYITRDLYLRRIVKDTRYKTLKDLLPRVGDESISHTSMIDVDNLLTTGWGSNEDADEELRLLMGTQKLLDYPKPVRLILKLMASYRQKDNIVVLDFFSGSATTAHAVMQLNAEDGGNRKFIMVQLPEKCDEKSEAYKAGYKNICKIGKERIRRAGAKIKDENGLTAQNLDTGFRVLKLDSSNMQDVYYNPAAVSQTLLDATIDNIKPDRTPLDLLFQVMLELGVPLSAKIEENVVNGKTYYAVNGNDIIACFDDDIDEEVITAIAKQQPLYAVFKDQSFASDSVAINNEQLFKTYSPATEIKVI